MKKNMNKLATLALTGILAAGMSFGAMAAAIGDNGAVTSSDTSLIFKKELKLTDVDDTNVTPTTPGVTFKYTISGATENATIIRNVAEEGLTAKSVTLDVYAPTEANGVTGTEGKPSIGTAAFTSTDTADSNKVVSKDVTVDFDGVSFSKPGIYRWVIKETNASGTSSYTVTDGGTYVSALKELGDDYDERILDVYVERSSSGNCVIKGYVLYKEGRKVGTIDGKSSGYTYEENTYDASGANESIQSSEYRTYDMTVEKKVTGSMADLSKKFDITTTFSSISSNITLTKSVNEESKATLDATYSGHTYKYSVSDGGQYKIQGIPFDATATVEEADYSSAGYSIESVTVDATTVAATEGKYAASNNNEGNKATAVVVTNKMESIPVTGVVMNIAPYAAMILGAGAFAGIFLCRKKTEDEE